MSVSHSIICAALDARVLGAVHAQTELMGNESNDQELKCRSDVEKAEHLQKQAEEKRPSFPTST